jgi:hypothetical protein
VLYAVAISAGNKAAAKGGSAVLVPRYFSLERLLSIYAQIVSIVEGHKPVGYGTVSIYATVSASYSKPALRAVQFNGVKIINSDCPSRYKQCCAALRFSIAYVTLQPLS